MGTNYEILNNKFDSSCVYKQEEPFSTRIGENAVNLNDIETTQGMKEKGVFKKECEVSIAVSEKTLSPS